MVGLQDFKNWLAEDENRKKGYLWNNHVWEALEKDFLFLYLSKDYEVKNTKSYAKSEAEVFFESEGYTNLARLCSQGQKLNLRKFDFQENFPRHAEIVEEWLKEQIIEQKKKKKNQN